EHRDGGIGPLRAGPRRPGHSGDGDAEVQPAGGATGYRTGEAVGGGPRPADPRGPGAVPATDGNGRDRPDRVSTSLLVQGSNLHSRRRANKAASWLRIDCQRGRVKCDRVSARAGGSVAATG